MTIRGKLRFLADPYGAVLLFELPDGNEVYLGSTSKGGPLAKERAAASAVMNLSRLEGRVRRVEQKEKAVRMERERRAKAKR